MQETCYRKYELSELNTSKPRKIKSFKGTVVNSLRSKNKQSNIMKVKGWNLRPGGFL